jgi:hypothetical protein
VENDDLKDIVAWDLMRDAWGLPYNLIQFKHDPPRSVRDFYAGVQDVVGAQYSLIAHVVRTYELTDEQLALLYPVLTFLPRWATINKACPASDILEMGLDDLMTVAKEIHRHDDDMRTFTKIHLTYNNIKRLRQEYANVRDEEEDDTDDGSVGPFATPSDSSDAEHQGGDKEEDDAPKDNDNPSASNMESEPVTPRPDASDDEDKPSGSSKKRPRDNGEPESSSSTKKRTRIDKAADASAVSGPVTHTTAPGTRRSSPKSKTK